MKFDERAILLQRTALGFLVVIGLALGLNLLSLLALRKRQHSTPRLFVLLGSFL